MNALGRIVLAGVLAGLILDLGADVRAQPPGSIPPVFAQNLRLPVRGDDLAQPRAVVADLHTGEIFVADTLRNRIVIFDREGRFRFEIRGGSSFQAPVDLAVDPDGYLFVLGQVSVDLILLDFDGRPIRRLALSGLPEDLETLQPVSLAISLDGDRLYVLDAENHRLWMADRDGRVTGAVDLTEGRSEEEIRELRYGHVDVYGDRVLVAISSDALVHMFDLDGAPQGTIGFPGAAECQTMFPLAAALDDQGRMIIVDQQRALFMTWDLDTGDCLSEHYGFGNAPGAFYQPNDIALDLDGTVYVSQGFEGRVQTYEGARPARVPQVARLARDERPDEAPAAVQPAQEEAAPVAPADEAAALKEVESEEQPTEVLEPAAPASGSPAGVLAGLVENWARAWSEQRVDDYLGFYDADFVPADGRSREDWESLRRRRVGTPAFIRVDITILGSTFEGGNRAAITFLQTYESNTYSDQVTKTLTLVLRAEGWKILREKSRP